MGYKKLDEVMELLTDELDGSTRSIDKLERLAQNVENIKIEPDTSEIERMLLEHLKLQKQDNFKLQESIHHLENRVAKARLVPQNTAMAALFDLVRYIVNHRLSGF